MKLMLVLLLLASSQVCLSSSESVYYIQPHPIPSNTLETHFRTLTNYINHKNDSNTVTLYFLAGNHILDKILNFTDMEEVLLIADTNEVSIQCIGQARLLFENISNITIERIQFIGCGENSQQYNHPAVEFKNCNGSIFNIEVTRSSTGAVGIQNSILSFTNLTVVRNKLNYTVKSFSALNVVSSSILLFGTITILENNAFSDQDAEMDCGSATYTYENIESVTFRAVNTTLRHAGTLVVTRNIAPSGTMNFENSEFQVIGKSLFLENTVCIHGALSFVNTNASLSHLTSFVNNVGSPYYYPGMIPVAGISLRGSVLHINGTTRFEGNKADIATLEAYTSNITITGELVDRDNSATYAGLIIRAKANMEVNGEASFTFNNHEDAVVRVESSNFTSRGKIIFADNRGDAPCAARYNAHFHFKGHALFKNNAGILDAVSRCSFTFEGNSTFIENNVKDFSIGGGMVLNKRSVLFLAGIYNFIRNRLADVDGGAIYADKSRIEFKGYGRFIKNSARNGGAIYLQNNSTVLLESGVNLEFIGNSAKKGGALFIYISVHSLNCESPNSQCFVVQNNTLENDHNITFWENKATEGGSVVHVKFVEEIEIGNNNITVTALESLVRHSTKDNTNPPVASDSFQLCFCDNNEHVCDTSVREVRQVNKGQTISVSIKAVTLMRSNFLYVRSYLKSSSHSSIKSLEGDIQYLREGCTELKYKVYSNASEESVVICADESCEGASDAKLELHIYFEDCPLGFVAEGKQCVCDQNILKNTTNVCNIDKHTMKKANQNFWIGILNNEHLVFFGKCPFDYCIHPPVEVNPSMPDTQCSNSRSGILCGACKQNMSLILGSSKCDTCPDNFTLFLIIPFAILGILLIAFLFLFQLTVSNGTIHGLILYASIVKANSATLQLQNVKVLNVFIAWLNLDFGIETCFYRGLDQLSKTGWQFVFPVYLWLLVGSVIVICHYSVRASRLFSTSNPVEVLATVILLSYTKLLQTIISIFSANSPDYSLHSNSPVWLYDGNVEFGQGAHAVLIAVGLFTLIFLFLPYTLVLISAQLLQKNTLVSKVFNRLRLTPFISAYQAPYRSGSRYWIGLCLFLRCVLLVAVGADSTTNIGLLFTSSCCVLLISIIGASGGIYSKLWLNALEISYILNLGILAAVTYHINLSYSLNERLTGHIVIGYISVTIALAVFIAIIIKQAIYRLKNVPKFKRKMVSFQQKLKKKEEDNMDSPKIVANSNRRKSSTTFQELLISDNSLLVELREPMLEYTDTK